MMLHLEEGSKWNHIKKFIKKYSAAYSILRALAVILLIILFIATFAVTTADNVQIVYINRLETFSYITSPKFLSITLDTSVIAGGFHNFNMTDEKLIKMVKNLSPAYIRIGGSSADRLYFSPHARKHKNAESFYRSAASHQRYNDLRFLPNFTMTGLQWLQLTTFMKNCYLNVIFDLNALIRFEDGSWDYRNAETLIKFSSAHNLKVNWELGNEPDLYQKSKEEVNATQMARDFAILREILKKYPIYSKSLLLGPGIARASKSDEASAMYLKEFAREAMQTVDAITWHQYYVDGHKAAESDFLNPEVFDLLEIQTNFIKNVTIGKQVWNRPLWLGETSSVYRGGAPGLSDRFIGSFLWVDKLGLSAKMGINVVCRQSIFNEDHSLLDRYYNPNPDWWISILYKKLVGPKVVPCFTKTSSKVRLYCHCTKRNVFQRNPPSVTIFGVNINDQSATIRIEGTFPMEYEIDPLSSIYAYEITGQLLSKNINLNGNLLKISNDNTVPNFIPKVISKDGKRPLVTMPPYSIVFWVVPSPYVDACLYTHIL